MITTVNSAIVRAFNWASSAALSESGLKDKRRSDDVNEVTARARTPLCESRATLREICV
jgi:hypothetical protein